jgi:Transposase DDE domain
MCWSEAIAAVLRGRGKLADVRSFIAELYGPDLQAKRIASLAGAMLGVMRAASLAVAMIGQALTQARGLVTKHAVKQVGRLLGNNAIDVWDSFARWVTHQIGERRDILVAMDWTNFDHDDQATLVLSLVTGHGRTAPLLWISVWKDELTRQRNDFEDACLRRLATLVPAGCRVTILADHGFGDQKFFAFLPMLGFGYVIRFRANIRVTDADGRTRPVAEWVGKGGRARKLADARVTAKGQQIGAVVYVHARDMKEPWCLASSERDAAAATLINHYARRWAIEPQFRDTKDLRFGMRLSATRVGEPMRRDRMLLISAFATALLTLLGTVGESLGMEDRLLKSNISRTRTHSLFRRGCMFYKLIPNMREHRLVPLIEKFAEAVSNVGTFIPAVAATK